MKQVLIIEDDEMIISLIRVVLEKDNILVEFASDGDEGIKKFNDRNFDLVVTDLSMPKCSGDEVCKLIKIQIVLIHL
jgi:two-component system OmpR family response regulator